MDRRKDILSARGKKSTRGNESLLQLRATSLTVGVNGKKIIYNDNEYYVGKYRGLQGVYSTSRQVIKSCLHYELTRHSSRIKMTICLYH